jgi:glycosyltransferase involved in cell wall biosynthesis
LQITPLILSYNEAPNLRRTLERLTWADHILVVDSFSTDETLEILQAFPQAQVAQRKFDAHAPQWNYGITLCDTPWVLALDADYVLSDELIQELKAFQPAEGLAACFAGFRYCIHGRPLRATLYPPRAVLFRKNACHYEQEGHTQMLRFTGAAGWLQGWIDHDDRKPLDRWLADQNRYALAEARHLLATPCHELNLPDRLRRKIVAAPFLVLFYTLFGKRLVLDGWAGWYYVFQRVLAELMLSLRLLERRLSGGRSENHGRGEGTE